MQNHLALVMVLAMTGCGGSGGKPAASTAAPTKAAVGPSVAATGDTCQQFIERSRPFFVGAAKNPSETLTDDDMQQLVELCRNDMVNDPLVLCVNGAPDDAGVLACWQHALDKHGATSTAPSAGRASP